MLDELHHPSVVEVIEKSSDVCVQHIAHLPSLERHRQRIQCLMLAAPRSESIREAPKVLLVNLIEDGDDGLLDDLVLQRRHPQRTLSPVGLGDEHSPRWFRSIRTAMNPAV